MLAHRCMPLVLLCLQETVESLKLRACAEFGLEPRAIEIWDFYHHSKYANLESSLDKTLNEARILDEQPILLDEKVGRCRQLMFVLVQLKLKAGAQRWSQKACWV
jgi:hypothetical protein